MCLIRCDVRINGTQSGPCVRQDSGSHHGTPPDTERCHRIRRAEQGVRTDTGGTNEGGTVLTAHPGSGDDVRPPTTNHRSTLADHRPTDEAVPAPPVRTL